MAQTKCNMTRLQDMIEALALDLPNVGPRNPRNGRSNRDHASHILETLSDQQEGPLTLLGLPAEIRDRIWEFALIQDENRGIIAPCPAKPGAQTNKLSINGAWLSVKPLEFAVLDTEDQASFLQLAVTANLLTVEDLARNAKLINPDNSNRAQSVKAVDLCADGYHARGEGSVFIYYHKQAKLQLHTGHICTHACLAQPSLTQVSRAVRKEALPVFYACNLFELRDLGEHSTCAMLWWSSVGDSNLRSIRSLLMNPIKGTFLRFSNEQYQGLAVLIRIRKKKKVLRMKMVRGSVYCDTDLEPEDTQRSAWVAISDENGDEQSCDGDGLEAGIVTRNGISTALGSAGLATFGVEKVQDYERILRRFAEAGLGVQTIEEAMRVLREGSKGIGMPVLVRGPLSWGSRW